jgi:hypothetical protein
MLIPLGILAASGAGFVDAYERIATASGDGSTTGSITFSSIPQTYKSLQVRYTAKNVTNNSGIFIQMNGIGGSSYATHNLRGDGTSVASSFASSQAYIEMTGAQATSTTAGVVVAGVIDILDYASTSKNTTVRALYGSDTTPRGIYLRSGLLNSTAAINSISFIGSAAAFSTLTRFSLYGIRG